MTKFLNNTGLARLVALIKQALGGKADKTELPLVVTFTGVGDNISCDTSIADIYAAYSSGRTVVGHRNGSEQWELTLSNSNSAFFSALMGNMQSMLVGNNDGSVDTWLSVITYYQEALTFDSAPTAGSGNPVTSGGVKTALDGKQATLVSGTNIKTVCGSSILGSGDLQLVADDIYTGYGSVEDALNAKQDTLVSGTNIKTVNNNSLLGSGNVDLGGGDILYLGKGKYVLENAVDSSIDNALDDLDNAIHELGTPNEIARITATESQTSGGNNVVTITETNGTTTTFNVKNGIDGQDGQDGADGVSLGEVALVQTTGDSTSSVMSQKAVKSINLHNATMFTGELVNYNIRDYPDLDPMQCEKLTFLIDRRYPSTSWGGTMNDSLTSVYLFTFRNGNDVFQIFQNGYQWQIILRINNQYIVREVITSVNNDSPNYAEHVVCCIDFKNAIASLYFNGLIAYENVSFANQDLTPYLSSLTSVSISRSEPWGNMGAAIFNDFLTASEVSGLYNSGTYVDWLIRNEYIAKSFYADVLPMTSLTGDGVRTNATINSVDVTCTGSNSNAYQQLAIPSYVEKRCCIIHIHLRITRGSINFTGFGTNGRWHAEIIDGDGDVVSSNTLTEGNEYEITTLRRVAPSRTSGPYFIRYTHTSDCSFTISNCYIKQIGAPVICAPQNYRQTFFEQDSGDELPTLCTPLYEPYKPKVVNTTSKYPQFTGQIAIDSATNKAYIGINKTWKQINNS